MSVSRAATMPPVQDSAVAMRASGLAIALEQIAVALTAAPLRRRLGGDAFGPPGEAQPFRRRRLDADPRWLEAEDRRDALDHRCAMGPDLRPLADERDVDG